MADRIRSLGVVFDRAKREGGEEMVRVLFGMVLGVVLGILLCDAFLHCQMDEGEG